MCNEVSSSSVDFDAYDKYYGSFFTQTTVTRDSFHENVFAQGGCCRPFTKTAVLRLDRSGTEERSQRIARDNKISPMDAGGSIWLESKISWGGSEGTTVSVGVSAEGHDDSGNSVEVEINQDSSGEGSISVSAGHEEE